MKKENLNELLLDLVISPRISMDVKDIAKEALAIYVKKLDCLLGVILKKQGNSAERITVFPADFIETAEWERYFRVSETALLNSGEPMTEVQIGDKWSYIFAMEEYGSLILARNKPLLGELITGLKSVVCHLGKILVMASDLEQRKGTDSEFQNLLLTASKTTDVIVITDARGRITYVNKAYEKLTEYSEAEVMGKIPGSLVQGPETDKTTVKKISQAIKELKTIQAEILNYTKSKRKYWQSITIDPVFNKNQECIAFVAINKDITERKKLEEEILRVKDFLNQTSKVARVGGWNFDIAENKLTWTDNLMEIFEVDSGFVPTLDNITGFLREGESRDLLSQGLEDAQNKGIPLDLELQSVTAKGNEFWTRVIGNTEIKDGVCTRIFGTVQDINEQKLSRIALEESETRYRNLFSLSPTGIAIHRLSDGSFITGNPALYKITGHTEEEYRLLKPEDLTPEKYLIYEKENLILMTKMGLFGPYEKKYISKNGNMAPVLLSGFVFNDHHGEKMIFSVIKDISEQERAEEIIRRKEKMLRSIALSTDELLSNPDIFDAIAKCLPIIGEAVDVDRVYLFQNSYTSDNKIITSQRAEWNSGVSAPQIDNPEMQNMPIEIFDVFLKDLYKKKPFKEIVSQLPQELPYKAILEGQDIQSILIIPIFRKDIFWGHVGFDECKYPRVWSDDEVSILKSFTNSISIAIERFMITEELYNLSLFPQENPNPLFRVDLEGNMVLRNKAAERIDYFNYGDSEYSFADFARKVAKEITPEKPLREYEVESEGKIFMIKSLLSENHIHINNYANNITELKKTQSELERLSLVASKNRQGVHFIGSDYKIIYTNEAFLKISGYTKEEILGRTPQELLHGPLTQISSLRMLESGHTKLKPVDVDIILYHKDKTSFWANIKKQPLPKNDDGNQEYFLIVEDISEKKLAEENLRNSEIRLSALITSLKEGILLEDENRKIVLTNNTFCSMFNINAKPEELEGIDSSSSAEDTKHLFRNPEEFLNRIDHIMLHKKTVLSDELELVSGQYFERDYIPIIINGSYKGHLWKYTDISERKRQESRLRQQEEKYRNIIANMRMGLLETDNDDLITYVNQQFCEMSGYSREELKGKKSIDLLVTDKYKDTVKDKNDSRLEGVTDIYQTQVKIKNGEERWWLTSGGPNYNDKGILIGTVGISVDITEQKILEQELELSRRKAEESSKTKEAFLANMSHEIRTPLNAIIGMIREISRETLSPKQNLYIKNASLASQHLLSILNDVLDISKIESGQINLDLRPFNLSEVINDSISITAPAAQEKMLKINKAISQMISPAYIGDSNRIKQILLNIINNSVKFTEKGSINVECILVGTSKKHHQIKLIISDTGIGMDDTFLLNIFDNFSQGDYSQARKYGGTGLGMAITYKLTRLMNGTINVSSRKGFGTTVEIKLDLETADAIEIRNSDTHETFTGLKQKKILLVEDNDLNRMVALNSLNYYDLDVTEAINGIEAIEKLKESTYDLILMDLQMPEMGGIEATQIIRKEMKLNTPIIALTANALKVEVEHCLEAGMNDYIIKPFEENVLLRVILKNISESQKSAGPVSSEEKSIPVAKSYNLDFIVEMSRGNKDLVKRLISIFIEQTPASVIEIKDALRLHDMETVRRVAHRIKPNIDSFGITDLKEDIRTIESMAEEGAETPDFEVKINRLEEVINLVVGQLQTEKF